MQIRDFSVFGMFKFLVVMNFAVIAFFVPIVLLAMFLAPDSVTWINPFTGGSFSFLQGGNFSVNLVETTSPIVGAIFLIINFLVLTWFQSAWVVFVANITPLGQIKIGRN